MHSKLLWISMEILYMYCYNYCHDDVIIWKRFLHYWPFVRGVTGHLGFSSQRPTMRHFDFFTLVRANCWINTWVPDDLRNYDLMWHHWNGLHGNLTNLFHVLESLFSTSALTKYSQRLTSVNQTAATKSVWTAFMLVVDKPAEVSRPLPTILILIPQWMLQNTCFVTGNWRANKNEVTYWVLKSRCQSRSIPSFPLQWHTLEAISSVRNACHFYCAERWSTHAFRNI